MDNFIESLLFNVIQSDDYLEELRELLDSGVDPNYQSIHGITPLLQAALSPAINIKIVQELIQRGADVDLSDHLSYTALHNAVMNRKRSVINELLQAGASVNAKCYLGDTPLHMATFTYQNPTNLPADQFIMCDLLLQEDIDCNARDFWGFTPLMLAATEYQEMAAVILLVSSADPNVCSNASESPLHVAFSLPPCSMELHLLFHGASIYSVDAWGNTPLDILIKDGLGSRDNTRIKVIFKMIAFKYSITSDLKKKLEVIPDLSQFFNECCNEIDYMRRDYISDNITMHDIVWHCFNENDFTNLLLQIHKPVIDRLIRSTYPVYFLEILITIPEFSLLTILQMTASSKKRRKMEGEAKDFADLLSKSDVIYLFLKYLSRPEIFCLIVAFSDAIIDESMQYLQQLDLSCVFYLKSNKFSL